MRLSVPVILGVLLGLSQASVGERKDAIASGAEAAVVSSGAANDLATPALTPTGDSSSPSSPSSPSSTTIPPSSSSGGGGDSSSDVTVTSTDTVTNSKGSGSTVTKHVTSVVNSTSTILATETAFVTTTITSSDQDTATKTVWSTTTITVNKRKRSVLGELPQRTTPAHVDAVPTGAPERRRLAKRATITVHVTVTVGQAGSPTTITDTVLKTAVIPTSAVTTITNTVTETEQANAKTTITITNVLTVTSTLVGTSVIQTSTQFPSTTGVAAGGSGGGSGDSSGGGLSTGAKIGIGVGVGGGGLLLIIGLVWIIMRRRDRGPPPDEDDLVGASEVPVGPSGRPPPMTSNPASTSSRVPMGKPVPEGYRGTAMGDGRAGFAKPDTYTSTYSTQGLTSVSPMPSVNSPYNAPPGIAEIGAGAHAEATPAAELGTDGGVGNKWHNPDAAEIDSRPVMSHQSGPVYEMPNQTYR